MLEALRASGVPALQARLEPLRVGRALENLATAFPAALTNGGSAARGRQLAEQHPAAQCTRCHTLGASTSTVGPSLNAIGAQLSREELLRALLDPSARVAPGFGQVSVTLRSGQKTEGVLREETDTLLVLELATGATMRVNKADVAARSNAVSAMPPMGVLLQPRDIRDVVEFLAGQRP